MSATPRGLFTGQRILIRLCGVAAFAVILLFVVKCAGPQAVVP
jgi:hypothetical protein